MPGSSSSLMDSLKPPRTKLKVTRSCTDYLLCQLTSDKKLCTLEYDPAEIFKPILEELPERFVNGLRVFAQVSRTCYTLNTPYRMKPLRVVSNKLTHNCDMA